MKLSGFQHAKVLGEGSYGKVYKTKRLCDNQYYALKIIDVNKLSIREIEDAVNEIRLMASVTSPFILSFYEAFADQKRLCIVTEYARIGDLRNLIERRKYKNRPFQEEQIWQFLLEILEGLRILHSCGVVHRDLKSANILISAPDLVKIGDLGIATVLHKHRSPFTKEMAKTQIGTPLYLAPEVWMHFPYDQKCDIWSLGVLLYELITFDFPFTGRTQAELQARICNGRYSIPKSAEKKYSKELLSILRLLLNVEPRNRPSVDDILKMESVQDHMYLLNPFLQNHLDLFKNSSLNEISLEGGHAKLLSTIHIPRANLRYNNRYGRSSVNLSDLQLPTQKYNRTPISIKPLEQRIQMKRGIPLYLHRNLSDLSSNEYIQIADQDLWTKNREAANNEQQQQQQQQQKFQQIQINEEQIKKLQQQNENQRQRIQQQIQQLQIDLSPAKHQNILEDRQQQIKQLQLRLQQRQQQQQQRHPAFERYNPINHAIIPLDNGAELRKPVRQYNQPQHSPILPPMQNHMNQPSPPVPQAPPPPQQQQQQIRQNPIPPIRIAPRLIPEHYANLYKPCQNNLNQDPRWKRKIPSLRRQVRPTFNDNNNNNIFFKQQQDVPWWFGQELQPSPVHVRKNPLVGFNPRFN